MPIADWVTRIVFGLVSLGLALLAGGLFVYAASHVLRTLNTPDADAGGPLLEAIGYAVIAIAVFDVAKYLFEEEAIRGRELRNAGEARRSLTKFLSTIAIVVFLEAIVALFEASRENKALMVYPTLLLLAGVALVVGLGVYLRLSAVAESELGGARGEARDEADFKAGQERAKSESEQPGIGPG